jgi:hypothetical protein
VQSLLRVVDNLCATSHGEGEVVHDLAGPVACLRPIPERLDRSSTAVLNRDTRLLEIPVVPTAVTRGSTERAETPCTQAYLITGASARLGRPCPRRVFARFL